MAKLSVVNFLPEMVPPLPDLPLEAYLVTRLHVARKENLNLHIIAPNETNMKA